MLLDEVFDSIVRTKKVWVRKDGNLKKVSEDLPPPVDMHKQNKPMFPIKSPRYE